MSMQIRDIFLYGWNGELRRLPFNLGRVNIVTGASGTGKSSLIEIVEYCLGNGSCGVPAGRIRETVAWYGLRLQFLDVQMIVCRQAPKASYKSNEAVFIDIGSDLKIPEFRALHANTNCDGLLDLLTQKCGVRPNVNVPPEGQTRDSLSANIDHARFLLFQTQSEIASKGYLFHRQWESSFIAQAIKDTLPYFLGAVKEDRFRKLASLRLLRRSLRKLLLELTEAEEMVAQSSFRAEALMNEAFNVGLVATLPGGLSYNGSIDFLKGILVAPQQPANEPPGPDWFASLRSERAALLRQIRETQEQLAATEQFGNEQSIFLSEAAEHKSRLETVRLIDAGPPLEKCPLCGSTPSGRPPELSQLSDALTKLSKDLDDFERLRPNLAAITTELQTKLARLREDLRRNREMIAAEIRAEDASDEIRLLNASQARVLGRISLFIEGAGDLDPMSRVRKQVEELRGEIAELEDDVDDEELQQQIAAILFQISNQMSAWAKEPLRLEHSEFPIHLSLSKLTVIANTGQGQFPMREVGSGKTWLGYHLVAHLALHKWFVDKKRPVPRFLFLDQPTQVFYPPDYKDEAGDLSVLEDEDRDAVMRMFKWLIDTVEKCMPNFQIIITDHADLKDEWFQRCVVEHWRGGNALIPSSWKSRD